MSDIPVGSPPAPPGRHAAPSGWYPDPVDLSQERYWDGWQWSRTTRPRGLPPGVVMAPGLATSPPPGAYPGTPVQPTAPPTAYVRAGRPGQASHTADGVPLASWWWRVGAGVIDALIVGVLGVLAALPIYRSMLAVIRRYTSEVIAAAEAGRSTPPTLTAEQLLSTGDQLTLAVTTVLVGVIYQVLFLRLRSASLGMLACGLRVVPLDQGRYAGRLGWGTIAVRVAIWELPKLSPLLSIFRLIDLLFPLWQPKRQTLHDIAAKTQVTRPG